MDALRAPSDNSNWELKLECLDRREAELHDTQLRLLRQQIGVILRDQGVLQREVADVGTLRNDVLSEVQTSIKEVQAAVHCNIKEVQSAHMALHARVAQVQSDIKEVQTAHKSFHVRIVGLEHGDHHNISTLRTQASAHTSQELESLRDEIRAQLKDLQSCAATKQELSCAATKQELSCAATKQELRELREGLLAEIQDLQPRFSLKEDLDVLRKELWSRVDDLQSLMPVSATFDVLREDMLAQMKDLHAYSRLEVGELGGTMARQLEEMEQKFAEHKVSIEALDSGHKGIRDHLHEHKASLKALDCSHNGLQEQLNDSKASIDELGSTHSGLREHLNEHANHLTKIQETHSHHASQSKSHAEFHHGSIKERLDALETSIETQLSSIMNACDEKVSDLKEPMTGDRLLLDSMQTQLPSMSKRIATVEKALNEIPADHRDSHTAIAERLDIVETFLKEMLERYCKDSSTTTAVAQSHDSSLSKRITDLEKLLSDSIGGHSEELKAIRSGHSKLASEIESVKVTHDNHRFVVGRLDFIEQLLGGSTDKLALELAEMKAAYDTHAKALGAHKEHHAETIQAHKEEHTETVKEIAEDLGNRIACLELLVTRAGSKQAEELSSAHSKLSSLELTLIPPQELARAQSKLESKVEQLHGRLCECEKHGTTLTGLANAHAHLKLEKDDMVGNIEERIRSLEHSVENELRTFQGIHGKQEETIATIDRQKDALGSNCSMLQDRVRHLEDTLVASVDKQAKMLDALRVSHARHDADIGKFGQATEVLSTLERRLDAVEPVFTESIDSHALQISRSIDQLRHRLAACEQHGSNQAHMHAAVESLHRTTTERLDRLESERNQRNDATHAGMAATADSLEVVTALGDKCATLHERLDHVEHLMRDSAGRYAKEFDILQAGHLSHSAMGEQCMYLERLIGDSADKHAQGLSASNGRLDNLQSRISKCEASCALFAGFQSAHDSLTKDVSVLDRKQTTLQERTENLKDALASGVAPSSAVMIHATTSRRTISQDT